MSWSYTIMIGFFFGFSLGVGCALAVMYTIYTNGYKNGVTDSLREKRTRRFEEALGIARKRIKREEAEGKTSSGSDKSTGETLKTRL